MNWYQNSEDTKHKVFVSYYHKDDQYYRNEFERRFSHLFISKSVEPGDIDSDLSDESITTLIKRGLNSAYKAVLSKTHRALLK